MSIILCASQKTAAINKLAVGHTLTYFGAEWSRKTHNLNYCLVFSVVWWIHVSCSVEKRRISWILLNYLLCSDFNWASIMLVRPKQVSVNHIFIIEVHGTKAHNFIFGFRQDFSQNKSSGSHEIMFLLCHQNWRNGLLSKATKQKLNNVQC